MKKGKKIIAYGVVLVLVVIISFFFIKIFSLKEKNTKVNSIEITTYLIDQLYSYILDDNYIYTTSLYSGTYTNKENLNYESMLNMIYNYIEKYDIFSLELLSKDELKNSGITSEPLYKISKEKFYNDAKIVFGNNLREITNDFKINSQTSAHFGKDFVYFYQDNNIVNDEYVTYKSLDSYTITDNNHTIIIYDTFLKCSKKTNLCYNDEKANELNDYVKYSDNLNIDEYKDKLKKYEHKFTYELGNYYWTSSQGL